MKRWKDIFNPHFTFFIIHTGIKQKQEPTRNNLKNKTKDIFKTSYSAYFSVCFKKKLNIFFIFWIIAKAWVLRRIRKHFISCDIVLPLEIQPCTQIYFEFGLFLN